MEVQNIFCFRQSWMDERLKYNATGITELALNWAFLAKIWVPDTYFVNGKKSYLHKITVPNRFVRISPEGRISYSQRLTIWANCPMDLSKFPLDSQVRKKSINPVWHGIGKQEKNSSLEHPRGNLYKT